jgi:hypothetical protein
MVWFFTFGFVALVLIAFFIAAGGFWQGSGWQLRKHPLTEYALSFF